MIKYLLAILFGILCSCGYIGLLKLTSGNIREGLFYLIIPFYVVTREFIKGGVFYKK